MSILLIDNYDSFTYNLYQMVQELTDEHVEVVRNDAITFDEIVKKKPSRIILSPGPGHPAHDADFGVCKDVIRQHAKLNIPILGVCLGHQGMVQHLGGKVGQAKKIVHGKTSTIEITKESKLFKGLGGNFEAMRYHSLVAEDNEFPKMLEITARTSDDGEIMALQHKEYPLYGVQFHPESIGTPAGQTILRNFVEIC
ncbi:MAG: aminodeoxychorismate/anthranilate synthase component II [Candidatus Obscuribacterales bacterium]|nr:aminodeoxychorismate/anthranilate synthase component II [Candidatus Obscuribacterales bacterium]